jgi:hypothetical protein
VHPGNGWDLDIRGHGVEERARNDLVLGLKAAIGSGVLAAARASRLETPDIPLEADSCLKIRGSFPAAAVPASTSRWYHSRREPEFPLPPALKRGNDRARRYVSLRMHGIDDLPTRFRRVGGSLR